MYQVDEIRGINSNSTFKWIDTHRWRERGRERERLAHTYTNIDQIFDSVDPSDLNKYANEFDLLIPDATPLMMLIKSGNQKHIQYRNVVILFNMGPLIVMYGPDADCQLFKLTMFLVQIIVAFE